MPIFQSIESRGSASMARHTLACRLAGERLMHAFARLQVLVEKGGSTRANRVYRRAVRKAVSGAAARAAVKAGSRASATMAARRSIPSRTRPKTDRRRPRPRRRWQRRSHARRSEGPGRSAPSSWQSKPVTGFIRNGPRSDPIRTNRNRSGSFRNRPAKGGRGMRTTISSSKARGLVRAFHAQPLTAWTTWSAFRDTSIMRSRDGTAGKIQISIC